MNTWVTMLNTTINILPIKQIYVCCFVKCKNGCLEISNRMANMGLHALWQGQYGSKCGFAKQYVWHHITSHHSKYISPYSQYQLESQPQTSYVIENKISRLIHKAPVFMWPRPKSAQLKELESFFKSPSCLDWLNSSKPRFYESKLFSYKWHCGQMW